MSAVGRGGPGVDRRRCMAATQRSRDRRPRTGPPSSGDGVDLAFGVARPSRAACRRRSRRGDTSRRPSRALRCALLQLGGLSVYRRRKRASPRGVASSANCARARHTGRKPSQTLSPLPSCADADSCRRSSRRVPISGKPWRRTQTVLDGTGAVFVQRARVCRTRLRQMRSQASSFGLSSVAFEKRHLLVEHARVAGGFDVATRRVREPQEIVGTCGCARRGRRADATSAARHPRETDARRHAGAARARRPGARWTEAITSCSWSRKPYAPPTW